jgi:hypothetical protein
MTKADRHSPCEIHSLQVSHACMSDVLSVHYLDKTLNILKHHTNKLEKELRLYKGK